jgi:long-chain acyl-CoA synthetase
VSFGAADAVPTFGSAPGTTPIVAALDGDEGWFHTGDLGHFDAQGFLYITGRKQHLIITSADGRINNQAGKRSKVRRIVPERIERQLAAHALIAQAVVYGGGPVNPDAPLSALITLNEAVETWAIQRGISFESRAQLADDSEVYAQIDRVVAEVNESLPEFERVLRFTILPNSFSAEADELTATGKLRRHAVIFRYRQRLDAVERTRANL